MRVCHSCTCIHAKRCTCVYISASVWTCDWKDPWRSTCALLWGRLKPAAAAARKLHIQRCKLSLLRALDRPRAYRSLRLLGMTCRILASIEWQQHVAELLNQQVSCYLSMHRKVYIYIHIYTYIHIYIYIYIYVYTCVCVHRAGILKRHEIFLHIM